MGISSLIAWCLFCTVTERSMPINQSTRDYFDVGDREELAYEEKLERYRELADAHLQADALRSSATLRSRISTRR